MSDQHTNDHALAAIIERDDELRQIVAKAEALGKLRDALRGISGRVALAESRAKLVGLLGSAKKGAHRRPRVELRYPETEDEDPKIEEERRRTITEALRGLSNRPT